ncbi:MAG: bifunctional riboflavin kinase/FAD synthetase [Anaeromyxobacteraceae bacterium]
MRTVGGMKVLGSIEEARETGAVRGGAVAIGNFDGVHLGHQALMRLARERAAARGAPSAVLTFDPHPVRVLRPSVAPPVLTALPRKLELLAGLGLDATVVQPFDLAWARTTAEVFVERDLAGGLGVKDVVVGHDFTAGNQRARVDALRPMLEARGIALQVVAPVASDGLVVSSTKIRELLLEGNVEDAAALLTRPHDVTGEVVRGAGRGRGFGFGTANVATPCLLPRNGVYAVRAVVGARAEQGGVCNVGVKPTVEAAGGVTCEVHLFDHDGSDLYGEAIRVAFVARLREERRFPSVDALRAQIAEDAAKARALVGPGSM